jgi:nucleoside-diphosphate-sugar epimerase
MSRVLVTGAGGFIGRHALPGLVAAGYEVHAVTSRPLLGGKPAAAAPPGAAEEEAAPEVRWHSADLLVPDSAARLVEAVRPSHLLHLAWYTEPGRFGTAAENLDWVAATAQLLRAFGEGGGRRAVVAGTCWEYAWERDTHCVEDAPPAGGGQAERVPAAGAVRMAPTPIDPATVYGAAKHAVHLLAERWASQVGVAFAWGRVFYVYGPHEHPARLVSGVARALLRGEEARCTDGLQVRDYLYAPEAGRAFAALLASEVTGPVNVASGELVRVADVVGAIAAAAGRPELVRLGALPQRPGDPERLTADVRRLREEVGFRPAVDLAEGARRTVAWWRRALAAPGTTGAPWAAPAPGSTQAAPAPTSAPQAVPAAARAPEAAP